MSRRKANPDSRRRTAATLCLALALLLGGAARPRFTTWPEQARLFLSYMKATAGPEEHMGLVERLTVSFLMAGQKAEKTKEAGARPASSGERI